MTGPDAAPPARAGRTAILVLLPFAGGYFLSYLFRTVNSVIGADLIRDLGLGAGDVGLLTAAYLLTFAAFQLPLGVLLDRFGPRRVNASLLAIAAVGALVFSLGDSLEMLILGRALIGLGVSAGLMSSFKAITQWFPRERWALVNGAFLMVGGLGAIAGTAPVQAALSITDWRGVFLALSIATICIAILVATTVPDRDEGVEQASMGEQIAGVVAVYRSPIFIAIAPVVVTSMAANLAIQGLWAGLWLRDVAALDRQATSEVLALLNVGMTLGFLGTGIVADRCGRRGIGLAPVMVGLVALFCVVQATIAFEVAVSPAILWPLFGLLANSTILCYPLVANYFSLAFTGRTNTAVNLSAFVGAFAAQYAIGGIIDLFPPAPGDRYVPAAYQASFGALLALQIAGLVWFLYAFHRIQRRGKQPAAA
ncbi:MAG: MFS transporter [Bauldia litoralis]